MGLPYRNKWGVFQTGESREDFPLNKARSPCVFIRDHKAVYYASYKAGEQLTVCAGVWPHGLQE